MKGGSEYWTYLLPRRVSTERAHAITTACLPVGTEEGLRLGMIDACLKTDMSSFTAEVERRAAALAANPALSARLSGKRFCRATDEAAKPLDVYRREELEHMAVNFFGPDPSYHVARRDFVHKVSCSRTPLRLARHRRNLVDA